MAEKNTINLLDAIKKQKNNDLIIFTTFTFDPIFFDAYILRKLKQNNPNAIIMVLMDFQLYSRLKEEKDDFTEVTGVEYILLPISGNLFHSKIFMFISESKKQTILGSHNLTLSGLAQNLELCFSSNDTVLFENCVDYVNSLLKKNLDSKDPLHKKIEPYVYSKTKNQRLLTNENEAILDQCLKLVLEQLNPIKEVIIFSPYFSETKKLIEKIMTLNPTEVKLCIQKNNHNLNPATVESFDRLSLNEVCKDNRRLHSKFIVFRSSDKDLILIGSPNFTSPALLKTSKDGNFESAMLFEINSDNFIKNYLNIDSITENEVKDSKRVVIQPTNSQTMPDIAISLAYFDEVGNLYVNYRSNTKKSLTLESYDKDQKKISTKELETEEGLYSVPFRSMPKEINEICFTENDEIVSNLIRVCNPKALSVRTQLDLTDSLTVEKILYDNKGFENIQDILLAIFNVPVERIGDARRKNDSEIIPSPGTRRTSKSSSGLFDLINKILKIQKTKTSSTSGQKPSSKKNVKQHGKSEIINNLMKKLYSKFKDFIITSPQYSRRYEWFLVIVLRVLRELESEHELGIACAGAIRQLNEIIKEDQSFSELSNIDRMKIFLLLEVLTKQYHKNIKNSSGENQPYTFDTSDAEILCAFKPMIATNSETYSVKPGLFDQLEKHPEFRSKTNNQTKFVEDEQKIDVIRTKFSELSDSI